MFSSWQTQMIIGCVLSLHYFLVVCGQNTGTAIQLPNLDSLDAVEAENVARIKADLENEAKEKKNAQNVVRLAATDQLNSDIVTNRTRAYLSCESGEMIVKINFTEPFRGVGYSDYDRSSPCKFYGDGGRYYEMRLPLKGCGTKQEAPRIFLNNIIVRFHRSLELEEDEIKTIICRYPPPLAPPPPLIAAPILESPPVLAPLVPAKLSEVELLLIVSALLFLTLLLLGIGMGYYCLKRRDIKVIKIPPPPYIPRVSLTSSESDYSESRSILSETSTVRRDHFRYTNMGFMPEPKISHMSYDDLFRNSQHLVDEDVEITKQMVVAPPRPQIATRLVDDRYLTNASHTDLDEDIEHGKMFAPRKPKITTLITDDYYITPTTTTEIVDEIVTQKVFVPPEKKFSSRQIDDFFSTPETIKEVDEQTVTHRKFGPSKITTQNMDDYYLHPEQETEITEENIVHRLYGANKPKHEKKTIDDYYVHPELETDITEEFVNQRIYSPSDRPQTIESEDDYYRDTYEIDEIIDDSLVHRRIVPSTTRTIQTGMDEYVTHSREVDEFVDDTSHRMFPIPSTPKITVQNIDDFYVTKLTDTEIDEKIIKTGRSMPNLFLPILEEENTEETSTKISSTGFDVRVRSIPLIKETEPTTSTFFDMRTTKSSETIKIDTILRIIENPPPEDARVFPPSTRNRLRTIIVTDQVFRTLIIESTTIEEYHERIQQNPSYGPLFEPPVWDVILRIFTSPEVVESTGETYTRDTIKSYTSAHEVRSVTEEDVSFGRYKSSSGRYVPPPDYPEEDILERSPNVETYSIESGPPYASTYESRYSSVFGHRRLADPSDPYVMASPSMRRRFREHGSRPYSPDIEALSLEPSSSSTRARTIMTLASSSNARSQHTRIARDDREESKSITETNVYDWRRSD